MTPAVNQTCVVSQRHEFPPSNGTAVFEGLPYGTSSSLQARVAEQRNAKLLSTQAEILVRIGVPFPSGTRAWPGGDLTLSGDIFPQPANANDKWVRVAGVFLNVSREAAVPLRTTIIRMRVRAGMGVRWRDMEGVSQMSRYCLVLLLSVLALPANGQDHCSLKVILLSVKGHCCPK